MSEDRNSTETETLPQVVQDLRQMLDHPVESLFDESVPAIPVAAIKALRGVVERSSAETMMGLQDELQRATADMEAYAGGDTIALHSGIELFLKYVTRTFLESPSFAECRAAILERGERFEMMGLAAKDRVASVAAEFILNDTTVLTLGFSRVVASVLSAASSQLGRHFDLIVLEGRPDGAGVKAAHSYSTETSIPVTVIPDAAAGTIMESVDMVLVGAEGVLENGGVVNKVGTLTVAACASLYGKPLYVCAESYKFARLYPLHQKDLPIRATSFEPLMEEPVQLDKSVRLMNPQVDFTPAKFIKLLFTDLGVLTPSAVSDELIRLYQ